MVNSTLFQGSFVVNSTLFQGSLIGFLQKIRGRFGFMYKGNEYKKVTRMCGKVWLFYGKLGMVLDMEV